MVFLITPANRGLYAPELDQMFRLRREVLVDQLHWEGLRIVDGREIDEFDTDNALYLGMQNDAGEVVGCMRLNPCSGPTLTSEKFAHLVQFRDLPRTASAFDVSRHLASRSWQQSLGGSMQNLDLLCALYEFGIAEGVTEFTAVLTANFFSALLQIGVELNAMGFASDLSPEGCLVISSPASERTLEALYRATRNFEPRLCSPPATRAVA